MQCTRSCPCNCCCCNHSDYDFKSFHDKSGVLPPYTSVYLRRRAGKLSRPKQMLMDEKLAKFKAEFEKQKAEAEVAAAEDAGTPENIESKVEVVHTRTSFFHPFTVHVAAKERSNGWRSWPFMRRAKSFRSSQPNLWIASTDIDLILRQKKVRANTP